jgi:putative Holliday junction resolvase
MAIDYGSKRSGLAVTDRLQLIAVGLDTVPSGELLPYIARYMKGETVERFVVGFPKQMDNKDSENMPRVQAFVRTLKGTFPDIPVVGYDERFTSLLAQRALLEGGAKKKKRRDKALVDAISAVIILQSWMESNKTKQL